MHSQTTKLRAGYFNRIAWLPLATAVLLLGPARGWCGQPPELPPLTAAGSPRLPGKFVWADLVTDDVASARSFYSRLFGWTFTDIGAYTIAANDDRPLAGMVQRPRPTNSAARPRWFAYISVPSVGKAQKAVTDAGGTVVMPEKKFPKRGAQAVFADPEGALFGVVKSSGGDPEDFLPDPGDWIWIELLSRNASKAADFYHAVAGYEVIENTNSNRVSEYVLASEGFARATVLTIPSEKSSVRPTWLPFVRVKSVAETVSQTPTLGGRVVLAPKLELLEGRVAVVADPTGAAIGIMEWSAEPTEGGR